MRAVILTRLGGRRIRDCSFSPFTHVENGCPTLASLGRIDI